MKLMICLISDYIFLGITNINYVKYFILSMFVRLLYIYCTEFLLETMINSILCLMNKKDIEKYKEYQEDNLVDSKYGDFGEKMDKNNMFMKTSIKNISDFIIYTLELIIIFLIGYTYISSYILASSLLICPLNIYFNVINKVSCEDQQLNINKRKLFLISNRIPTDKIIETFRINIKNIPINKFYILYFALLLFSDDTKLLNNFAYIIVINLYSNKVINYVQDYFMYFDNKYEELLGSIKIDMYKDTLPNSFTINGIRLDSGTTITTCIKIGNNHKNDSKFIKIGANHENITKFIINCTSISDITKISDAFTGKSGHVIINTDKKFHEFKNSNIGFINNVHKMDYQGLTLRQIFNEEPFDETIKKYLSFCFDSKDFINLSKKIMGKNIKNVNDIEIDTLSDIENKKINIALQIYKIKQKKIIIMLNNDFENFINYEKLDKIIKFFNGKIMIIMSHYLNIVPNYIKRKHILNYNKKNQITFD